MTGPEHYLAAENLLGDLRRARTRMSSSVSGERTAAVLAEAQVHATLALAAASAMGAAVEDDLAGLTVEERDAWFAVAGTKPGQPKAGERDDD